MTKYFIEFQFNNSSIDYVDNSNDWISKVVALLSPKYKYLDDYSGRLMSLDGLILMYRDFHVPKLYDSIQVCRFYQSSYVGKYLSLDEVIEIKDAMYKVLKDNFGYDFDIKVVVDES